MQAYLIVWSQGGKGKRIIVGTKRWLNAFWQNSVSLPETALNQSGQFAPNGGRVEHNRTAVEQAETEFREETGIPHPKPVKELYVEAYYTVCHMELSEDELDQLLMEMNMNVAPDAQDPNRPAGATVEDWEFEKFEIVKLSDAQSKLGVQAPVPDTWTVDTLTFSRATIETAIQVLLQKNRYSQDIDWYADIATRLQSDLK